MAGFYGKLPGKGDFLTRNLPRQFVDVWDDWLQSGMNAAKQVLGDEWLQVYLTSALWRFVLPPGICGESAWAGVMMPSMDRVGRYFPMTVAVELTLPVSPVMVAVSCSRLAMMTSRPPSATWLRTMRGSSSVRMTPGAAVAVAVARRRKAMVEKIRFFIWI